MSSTRDRSQFWRHKRSKIVPFREVSCNCQIDLFFLVLVATNDTGVMGMSLTRDQQVIPGDIGGDWTAGAFKREATGGERKQRFRPTRFCLGAFSRSPIHYCGFALTGATCSIGAPSLSIGRGNPWSEIWTLMIWETSGVGKTIEFCFITNVIDLSKTIDHRRTTHEVLVLLLSLLVPRRHW